MSNRGVEVDICPSCLGVWLDKDELTKIQSQLSDSADDSLLDDLPGAVPDKGFFKRISEWFEDIDFD